VRNAHAQHRQKGGESIHPGIAEIACNESKQRAQDESDQRGHSGQPEGVADGAKHLGADRAACGDGCAEVALEGPPQPGEELLGIAAVKPVELTDACGELGRRVGWQYRDQRVAGCQVNQRETDQRHAQHDGQRIDQSPDEVGKQSTVR